MSSSTEFRSPTTVNVFKGLLAISQFLAWACSVVVLGLSAWLYHHWVPITCLLVVSAIFTLVYLPALAFPFLKKYKGYMGPVAWVFSYVWLAYFALVSLVLLAVYLSVNGAVDIVINDSPDSDDTYLELTYLEFLCVMVIVFWHKLMALDAFIFLTFFFTFTNVIWDYMLSIVTRRYRKESDLDDLSTAEAKQPNYVVPDLASGF